MDSHSAQPAPTTLDAKYYSDPAFWPLERQAAFASQWQFVTHQSALDVPGAWRLEVLAGYSILIVKGMDGIIRAFHNVCRHRAGPLVKAESGQCDGHLTCQYHGWKYMADGRLRLARDFGASSDFDPRDYGLFAVEVAIWRGLIFVAIEKPDQSLESLIAPLEARLKGTDWSNLTIALRRHHEMQCNWKTYVENYLEGYHVPDVHPGLDAEVEASQYHVRVEGHIAIHEVPPKVADPVYEGLWAWAWPNIGINVYQTGLMIERMSPIGHDRTRLDYLYMMPPGIKVSEATLAMSDTVTAEDIWIVEHVQNNLNTGIYQAGRLSPKHEGAVAAFQSWLRPAYG